MPLFVYSAITESGILVTHEAVAASADALRAELAARGLLVQEIRAQSMGGGRWQRKIRTEDIAPFIQEFAALLRAGLTITESLALAASRPDCPSLERVLARVLADVKEGLALSEALAKHPDAFDRLFLATLTVGEKSGDLHGVLIRYQDYLRHRLAVRRRFSQALAYPAFLLIALAVILAVLFLFVLPRFVAMYADFGAALPWPTQVMITVVEQLPVLLPLAIGFVFLIRIAWRRWMRTAAGRLRSEQLLERLPYVGGLRRAASVALLSRTLSTLLSGGFPLVAALRAANEVMSGEGGRQRLTTVCDKVSQGESLAVALRSVQLLPEAALRMVAVGEASSSLPSMFAEIAQFHDEILAARLARVMALVEPVLMLLMGVMVGAVIIVMYLPVFHMADVIR